MTAGTPARWPVRVDGWQQECCGQPFGLHDVVTWTLAWQRTDPAFVPGWVARDWRPDTVTVRDGGALVAGDGVTAWARSGPDPEGWLRSGHLAECRHGLVPDDLPATTGVVERIRLVSLTYRPDPATGTLVPDGRPPRLRDLTRAPRSFQDGPGGVRETSLLVDLTVRPG